MKVLMYTQWNHWLILLKKIMNKNYVYKSNKKEELCIIEKCINKRSKLDNNILDFCDIHKHVMQELNDNEE